VGSEGGPEAQGEVVDMVTYYNRGVLTRLRSMIKSKLDYIGGGGLFVNLI